MSLLIANLALQSTRDVILLGAGGHAKVLIDALQRAGIEVTGIVDPVLAETHPLWRGISVIGNDDDLLKLNPEQVILINGTGGLPYSSLRQRLFSLFTDVGFQFMNVIHPSAFIGSGVDLGMGVQIMAGAIIQADTAIGSNSIINTGALIDHDCVIESHVNLAPGVVVSGGVRIGEGAHIGPGATIIQGISIGAGAIVGAGTVVVKDLPEHHKLLGQAPRPIIKLESE